MTIREIKDNITILKPGESFEFELNGVKYDIEVHPKNAQVYVRTLRENNRPLNLWLRDADYFKDYILGKRDFKNVNI